MSNKISRRRFFNTSMGVGAGMLFFKGFNLYSSGGKAGKTPIIITDHTNETGQKAMKAGWEILAKGGTALDAVEKSANIIELDAEDISVGYGGLPNENGIIQLDASIMDGKTYNAGAVACLENIKNPASVARIVMERTDHVLLVGKGALTFAKQWGFKEEDLMTDKARKIWIKWKEGLSDRDDWGPPDHLKNLKQTALNNKRGELHLRDLKKMLENEDVEIIPGTNGVPSIHGTTNHLAVDKNGDIAGITTTSGLSWKIPGRVGDSPIIGAGLYVDNEVGAAGATGRGEDVIKSCATYYIVMRMHDGRTPQQACEDAMKMIVAKYKKVNSNFFPSEKFVAVNKKGEYGCAYLKRDKPARMCVADEKGIKIYTGSVVYKV
ncbi:MAG: N(4)-(beta-N-acetylglucosaminyl)-L-asparaginase [bacterium]|nr:N(4)-(beta-N-acetylglucosaminyl)-L-asparaginase [bacterium]